MPTRRLELAAFAVAILLCTARAGAQTPYGIGRVATPAEIAGWNVDVGADGSNLPPGSGSVSHGSEVFDQQCAACHGAKGEGGIGDRLVGGQGTLATPKPVRTSAAIGHMRRPCSIISAAPCRKNAPQSLSNDDVYAVSAYILHLNGLLPADATLDAKTLAAIKMPNRNMFVGDPRPDVKNPACMSGC